MAPKRELAKNRPLKTKQAKSTTKAKASSSSPTKPPRRKIRLGILVGKNFDPVPRGTQDRQYPERFKCMNNTGRNASGWGGMFMIDVSVGLKIGRLHPDLFKVDIMTGKDITESRCKKNHLNFNLWYDVGVAMMSGDQKHVREVMKVHKNPGCRVWPSFEYYDWIITKPRYMRQCMEAGIPMIETIFLEDGFDPNSVLEQVQSRGWDKFFVKSATFSFFGSGAINGRTQDFLDNPAPLESYALEHKDHKQFLVQPCVLRPNGQPFDEVRNFFIDGEWSYSVYTDGVDYDAVWEEPPGKRKEACKKLAERAYKEVLKASTWRGRPVKPLMSRVDVGVVPDRSFASGYRVFLNELELEMSAWLARYCPFNLCSRMAEASVKKARELLAGLLEAGEELPDSDHVQRALAVLDERLGTLVA